MATSPDGDIWVVGTTYGTFPGTSSAGGRDAWVRRFAPNGDVRWTAQIGTAGAESAFGIAIDRTGRPWIAGGTTGSFPDAANRGGEDAYAARLTVAGAVMRVHQAGSKKDDVATGLAAAPEGGVTASIVTDGRLGGGPAGPEATVVRSIRATGSARWTVRFDGPGDVRPRDIAARPGGGYVIAATTDGVFAGATPAGGSDAVAIVIGSTGGLVRVRLVGSVADEVGTGAAIAKSGRFVLTGLTTGALGAASNAGGADLFTARR